MKLFVVTVDTEADCGSDWVGRSPESFDNIDKLRSDLLSVTDNFGAPVTLLLNADVIARKKPSTTCQQLAEIYGWELGSHLHGELVEPQRKCDSQAGVRLQDLQCLYTPELELAKMRTLRGQFADRFGFTPTSFRAGRYGASTRTLDICCDLGYEAETSVVPGQVIRDKAGVVDFRHFGPSPAAITYSGRRLVEVPITVKPGAISKPAESVENAMRRLPASGRCFGKLYERLRSVGGRLLSKANRPLWLRPSYSSASEMAEVLVWITKYSANKGRPAIANLMFHSNELLPCASPYTSTADDVACFLAKLDSSFRLARELGYKFTTLTAAARLIADQL